MNIDQIQGVVLAGGQGRRMGGVDKGLQPWHGQSLIDYSIQAIQPLCRSIIINCNRNLATYQKKSQALMTDIDDGFNGPLSGLVSVITGVLSDRETYSDVEWLLVSPCDTPNIGTEEFRLLIDQIGCHPSMTLLALTDSQKQHPLHCLVHRSMFQRIIQAYHEGQRSVFRVFKRLNVTWVHVTDEERMRNVNTLP